MSGEVLCAIEGGVATVTLNRPGQRNAMNSALLASLRHRFEELDASRDVRGSLPVTETMPERVYSIPWFKHYRPRIIEEHAEAFRKVAEHTELLR